MPRTGRPQKERPPASIGVDAAEELARRQAIGARARQCRERLGWSLRDAAATSGLSPEQIRLVEEGRFDPKMGTLFRLAKALQCTEKWLIFGSD